MNSFQLMFFLLIVSLYTVQINGNDQKLEEESWICLQNEAKSLHECQTRLKCEDRCQQVENRPKCWECKSCSSMSNHFWTLNDCIEKCTYRCNKIQLVNQCYKCELPCEYRNHDVCQSSLNCPRTCQPVIGQDDGCYDCPCGHDGSWSLISICEENCGSARCLRDYNDRSNKICWTCKQCEWPEHTSESDCHEYCSDNKYCKQVNGPGVPDCYVCSKRCEFDTEEECNKNAKCDLTCVERITYIGETGIAFRCWECPKCAEEGMEQTVSKCQEKCPGKCSLKDLEIRNKNGMIKYEYPESIPAPYRSCWKCDERCDQYKEYKNKTTCGKQCSLPCIRSRGGDEKNYTCYKCPGDIQGLCKELNGFDMGLGEGLCMSKCSTKKCKEMGYCWFCSDISDLAADLMLQVNIDKSIQTCITNCIDGTCIPTSNSKSVNTNPVEWNCRKCKIDNGQYETDKKCQEDCAGYCIQSGGCYKCPGITKTIAIIIGIIIPLFFLIVFGVIIALLVIIVKLVKNKSNESKKSNKEIKESKSVVVTKKDMSEESLSPIAPLSQLDSIGQQSQVMPTSSIGQLPPKSKIGGPNSGVQSQSQISNPNPSNGQIGIVNQELPYPVSIKSQGLPYPVSTKSKGSKKSQSKYIKK